MVNAENYGLIEELAAEDFVDHEEFPGTTQDRDGIRQFFELRRAAFLDLRFEVRRMIAEGDTVVVQTTMHGTHQGEFMGCPPRRARRSPRTASTPSASGNDRAVEHWGVTDGMAMMEQIGALETTGATTA